MLGLALGSSLAGPLLSLVRQPFLLLAALELAIGIYGILSLRVFTALGSAYGQWVSGPLENETSRRLLLRAAVCAGGLIVPTTLMGLTFPVLRHAVAPTQRSAGGTSAQLYAANTAGAALSALLAGFVLIATLGLTYPCGSQEV